MDPEEIRDVIVNDLARMLGKSTPGPTSAMRAEIKLSYGNLIVEVYGNYVTKIPLADPKYVEKIIDTMREHGISHDSVGISRANWITPGVYVREVDLSEIVPLKREVEFDNM